MKNVMFVLLGVALIFGSFFMGCSEDNSTGPDIPSGDYSVKIVSSFVTPSGWIISDYGEKDLDGYMLTRNYFSDGVEVYAEFFDNEKTYYAGEIKVNNHSVDTSIYQETGKPDMTYYYEYQEPGIQNIKFDGSNHNWTVEGYGAILNLTANSQSPSVEPDLILPKFFDEISKSKPFTVKWSAPGADEVNIFLLTPQTKTLTALVKNGNSVTFTPEQMQELNLGASYIRVSAAKYRVNNANSKRYLVVSEYCASKPIYMVE